jgi:sulfur carrier protein
VPDNRSGTADGLIMTILLNGNPHELKGTPTLAYLLDSIGAPRSRVAVVLNNKPVPRAEAAGTQLRENDRVELLTFAEGG